MPATFARMFAHAFWADDALLAAIAQHHAGHERILRLMGHVLAAERIWAWRVLGRELGAFTPWSPLTLPEMQRLAADNRRDYAELLPTLTPQRVEEVVEYRTSTGVAMRSRLGDILLQVALHGSYHRGQIAAAITAAGGTPPGTDYILYCRSQAD